MNKYSISIIIPTFNSAEYLSDCLTSLTVQTYREFEVLIMDGLSKDNTINIANLFANKLPSIRIYSEADKGIYDAMNKGVNLSKGNWVYFLGSDDALANENALLFISDWLTDGNNFVYGNVYRTNSKRIYDGAFDKEKLMHKNICHQAIFYHVSLFQCLGGYDLQYKICADWAFNLKCFGWKMLKPKHVNTIVCNYRDGGTSGSVRDEVFYKNQLRIISQSYHSSYWNNIFQTYKYTFLTKAIEDKAKRNYPGFLYFYLLFRFHLS